MTVKPLVMLCACGLLVSAGTFEQLAASPPVWIRGREGAERLKTARRVAAALASRQGSAQQAQLGGTGQAQQAQHGWAVQAQQAQQAGAGQAQQQKPAAGTAATKQAAGWGLVGGREVKAPAPFASLLDSVALLVSAGPPAERQGDLPPSASSPSPSSLAQVTGRQGAAPAPGLNPSQAAAVAQGVLGCVAGRWAARSQGSWH